MKSCSNVLNDRELRLRELTLEDERSFLRDAQPSAVALKTYGNYKALACETSNPGPYGSVFFCA